jgi:hypothetical protein
MNAERYENLPFSININSPKGKIWHTMLDTESFRVWTAELCECSYFEGF